MGYYMAGSVITLRHHGRRADWYGQVRTGRDRRYYMAGGFFSKLKKLGGKVAGIVKVASPLLNAIPVVGPITSAAVNFATRFTSPAQQVGRIAEMFSPSAAPAGQPMDGTAPLGAVATAATYGGMNPYAYGAAAYGARRRRYTRRRRRRY